MQVSEIKLLTSGDACQLQALVGSAALAEPFLLWYRFPASLAASVAVDSGDPWIAALLLPAMWAGEALEVPAPTSPALARSLQQVESVYRAWLPSLASVPVAVPLRKESPAAGEEVGLFFSSGVDSWYSLLKNASERRHRDDAITQLIVVHGADIDVGDSRKQHVFDTMLANSNRIARELGKSVLPVATNVRFLYYKLGISWHWSQGGALASVGLAAERLFRKLFIATWLTYAEAALYPELSTGGCHPFLDPLWSTENCTFVHDGCEATRLEKIRFLAGSPLVMESLRVCWTNDAPQFNCGRCAKCLRTMLALQVAGALGKCRTLPPRIDPEHFRKVTFLFPHEFVYFEELVEQLGGSHEEQAIREALAEGIQRGQRRFEQIEKARRSIGALDPADAPLILVDEEAIRFELGRARPIVPFPERNGSWWGRPADDETAIRELERQRRSGCRFLAFWKESFWWLDYYAAFGRHVRTNCQCILEGESLMVFDLGGAREPRGDH